MGYGMRASRREAAAGARRPSPSWRRVARGAGAGGCAAPSARAWRARCTTCSPTRCRRSPLQLEGARLLARRPRHGPRGRAGAIERAHGLAARRAGGGAPGDRGAARRELPGPERLPALAEAFSEQTDARATSTSTGEPRELPLRGAPRALPHRPGGADERAPARAARPRRAAPATTQPTARALVVEDHGRGRARRRRAPSARRGYGLTGMRERAELLGGRLDAGADRRRLPRRAVAAGVEPSIRVLLADDQRVVREGLACCSACSTGIEVVGTAADGEEAVALAGRARPTSSSWTCGCRAATASRPRAASPTPAPRPRVIALTTYADDAVGARRAARRRARLPDQGRRRRGDPRGDRGGRARRGGARPGRAAPRRRRAAPARAAGAATASCPTA